GVKHVYDGKIETVYPHAGPTAEIPMIMKSPGRREDEIARPHRRALAVNRGVRALAFDDKPDSGSRVAVGGSDFARKDQLNSCVQALGDLRNPAKSGIFQHKDAADGFFG